MTVPHQLYIFPATALYVADSIHNEQHAHFSASLICSRSDFTVQTDQTTLTARALLLPPNFMHSLEAPGPGPVMVLQADPDSRMYAPFARILGDTDGPVCLQPEAFAELILGHTDSKNGCATGNSLQDRFFNILADYPTAARGEAPGLSGQIGPAESHMGRPIDNDARVAKVVRHLGATDFERAPSVEELAALVDISADRLMRLFKAELGLPLRRYTLWLRLRRAVSCTAQGMNLTEAAHQAGFADSAHLSRTFREMYGQNPSFFLGNTKFVQVSFCNYG